MRLTNILFCVLLSITALAEKQTPHQYIERYKDLAIIEMHRSGVPASITLAQGILESSSGNSRLAKYANNHFGIKCKGHWEGDVIYADDDAPNECFRAYNSVLDSYKDHSEFLRKNWRYHPLFELSRTDYKGWCRGLKKAGYATNPKYHKILINLIERYELQEFDELPLPSESNDPLIASMVNDIPVLVVKEGQSMESIAVANDVRTRHIRRWNDLDKGQELKAGDIIFLKPKRRRAKVDKHQVEKGETMHFISQKYGIRLKHLYKKNRMKRGMEPAEGETLNLRKKRNKQDKVKLADPKEEWFDQEEEFVNPHTLIDSSSLDFTSPGAVGVVAVEIPEYHQVTKGDNIYRIAEKYRVLEEDILTWNTHLDPTAISIGDLVYLSQEAADKYKDNAPLQAAVEQPVMTHSEEPAEEVLDDEEADQLQEEVAVTGAVYHKVVKGDTVYNICKRFKITKEQLKAWNELSDFNIKIGQSLKVSE